MGMREECINPTVLDYPFNVGDFESLQRFTEFCQTQNKAIVIYSADSHPQGWDSFYFTLSSSALSKILHSDNDEMSRVKRMLSRW